MSYGSYDYYGLSRCYPRHTYFYSPGYWYGGYGGYNDDVIVNYYGDYAPYAGGYNDTIVYDPSLTGVPAFSGGAVDYLSEPQTDTDVSNDYGSGSRAAPRAAGPPLVERGNAAFAAGRYSEARGWYIRAVLADGSDGDATLLYGLSNFALGDYRGASAAIRRALNAAPDLIDRPINVTDVYAERAGFEAQMARLTDFVKSAGSARPSAEDRDARLLAGYLYFASEQPESALALFDPLVADYPDDPLAGLVRDACVRVLSR